MNHFHRFPLGAGALLAALVLAPAAVHGHAGVEHASTAQAANYTRSLHDYRVPEVSLIDQFGKRLRLKSLLEAGDPVLLQFVFTSCTTVCPVQAAVFSNAQPALAELGRPYQMVSISIDPEQDAPGQLLEFANKFKAGAQWRFLTGARQDVAQVLKAFGATLPANNKMFHQPYTFLHAGSGSQWVKLDGMLSLAELAAECKTAFAPTGAQTVQLARQPSRQ
ncbi:MAG: SCO family protein [Pseudomonadota bacterium]